MQTFACTLRGSFYTHVASIVCCAGTCLCMPQLSRATMQLGCMLEPIAHIAGSSRQPLWLCAYQLADLGQGLLECQGVPLAGLVALPDQAGLIPPALLYVPATPSIEVPHHARVVDVAFAGRVQPC